MQKAIIVLLSFTVILAFLVGVRYGAWVESQNTATRPSPTPIVRIITATPKPTKAASPSAVIKLQPTNLPSIEPEAQ
ncbi:MAG: hypothetical protein NUV52_01110 [Candidatus Roizmanbacteria bacterium]|nr:hypothetical protein [Candidatus Roizmanbacteria bacterium]